MIVCSSNNNTDAKLCIFSYEYIQVIKSAPKIMNVTAYVKSLKNFHHCCSTADKANQHSS